MSSCLTGGPANISLNAKFLTRPGEIEFIVIPKRYSEAANSDIMDLRHDLPRTNGQLFVHKACPSRNGRWFSQYCRWNPKVNMVPRRKRRIEGKTERISDNSEVTSR
jgi:hypothetical protein